MIDRGRTSRNLGALTAPSRNNYFYGKLMDVWHFEMEQAYNTRHRWLINRLSLGAGVLCGLQVAATQDQMHVRVGPGVAVDGLGREIIVPDESPPVDVRLVTDDCGQPDPEHSPIDVPATVTLCLHYLECAADPAPAMVGDCDVRKGCIPSTIRERYRLQIRTGDPPDPRLITEEQCETIFSQDSADGDRRDVICDMFSGTCSDADDSCVVLATISIADDGTIENIDSCAQRSTLYSNAMLFDLLLCLAERVDACCAASMMLRYISGDNQTADPNETVADPLIVEVLQRGNPVENEAVDFDVVTGNGQIGDDPSNLQAQFSTSTDASGRATLPIWQLGTDPGEQQVRATIAEGSPGEVIFRANTTEAEVTLPVVRAIWPQNAQHLTREDDPQELQQWIDQPRIEVTFDQEMNGSHLDDPDSWIRLWRVRSFGDNEIEVQRIHLGHAGRTDTPASGEDGHTHLYRAEITFDESVRSRFLVQIRAENDNIQNAESPPRLLDADYAGSELVDGNLDRIWEIDVREMLGQDVWDELVDSGAVLPQSGNGTEGGRFNSWFQVMLETD